MHQREARSQVKNSIVQLVRSTSNSSEKDYRVLNISRGGLCFHSNDEFDLNEIVKLSLMINQQAIHKASGRVCYRNQLDNSASSSSTESHYGLSFLDHFIDADYIRENF